MKWLYRLGDVDIHVDMDYPSRILCENGFLDLAKLIYNLGGVDITILNDYTYRKSCE